MTATVKSRLIKKGNSHYLIIPDEILKQLKLENEVKLTVQANKLIIRSLHRPRSGWRKQFKAMARAGDDRLLDIPISTQWDNQDWS